MARGRERMIADTKKVIKTDMQQEVEGTATVEINEVETQVLVSTEVEPTKTTEVVDTVTEEQEDSVVEKKAKRKGKGKKKIIQTYSMSEDLVQMMDAYQEKMDISKSQQVRDALREYFEKRSFKI